MNLALHASFLICTICLLLSCILELVPVEQGDTKAGSVMTRSMEVDWGDGKFSNVLYKYDVMNSES